MFHRIGAAAYKANLDTTIALCDLLGNPQRKFKSVHVAGTNGKGSTSHLIASILQSAGYKTGLYTSPHLKDFRERIRINGKMIPKKRVVEFINTHESAFRSLNPSFFEMTFGLAMEYFAENEVDIAVVETGMGGRLDSTNVVDPVLSIITNISKDHIQFLGNTLKAIATEKAGIIKAGVPLVVGEFQAEVAGVFVSKAADLNAPMSFADKIFHWRNLTTHESPSPMLSGDLFKVEDLCIKRLQCPLTGIYQQKNLLTVMESCRVLTALGYQITPADLKKGCRQVIAKTGFRGRWEQIGSHPRVICDTGHNEAGITELMTHLHQLTYSHLHFVLGMVNDKEVDSILSLLPANARYYFCKAYIPRGMDENLLKELASKAGLHGSAYSSVKEAYQDALRHASADDLVLIGGSTFVVAEVI